jgi:2-C-methyl-D-erythritol 4-phosphate cytidylyltransferase
MNPNTPQSPLENAHDASYASTHFFALVPCAGSGARAETAQPKQYQRVLGEPLVAYTVRALSAVERLSGGLLVLAPDDTFDWSTLKDWPATWSRQACGGVTRAHSVYNGLLALRDQGAADADWVLVHDAARCLVTPQMVDALMDACQNDPVGGLLALPLPDTLKLESSGRVASTLGREGKWLAQTPQMFRLGDLRSALQSQMATQFLGVTDEASAMEMAGHHPLLVQGSAVNFKVTYPQDFDLAEAVLESRRWGKDVNTKGKKL